MVHRVLHRQLRKLGLDPTSRPESDETWAHFLDRISRAYADADQDRYLLERSLAISSREMQELYGRLLDISESRLAVERDKLRAAKEDLEKRVAARTAELSEANRQLLVELTEREEAERQIRKQATLLDHAQDAICVLNDRACITYWNRSAERLYGWTPTEAVGRHVGDLLFGTDDNQYAEARALALADGEWTGELKQVTKEGDDLVVESRWTFVQGPDDELGSILIVNTDVTERKALEMQFLRAQRLESLGTLAGGIAHDLNNILGPILMSTEMLQMQPHDARSRKLLDTMETSTRRAADMVRQVLSFARGVKGERVAVPLKPLIAELAKILKEAVPRSIRLHFEVAPGLWTVDGDVTQLHQVLMNLCLNARDAMPNGGTIDISARNIMLEKHYARFHVDAKPGPYVLVWVSDTGQGMTPDVQDKIFEPFFTTKEKGSGLGLSTALGIVTSHGGFINVYTEPGQGTSFKVYLPAHAESVKHAVNGAATKMHKGAGELVLIVDDEEAFRDVTRQFLEEHGYRTLTASEGREALHLYQEYDGEIQVVITDVMMPVMDGPALIRALREINPEVKVIAASGLSTKESLADQVGVAVEVFLSKPYDSAQLLAVLHRTLHGADTLGLSLPV